jgi:hypothetical protein
VVYSNPAYFVSALLSPLRKLARATLRSPNSGDTPDTIYFHRYPLKWWQRFRDSGTLAIYPWRTFSTREQKALFPNNRLGTRMLSLLFALEDKYPRFFTLIGCYPMIVITKA